MHLCFIVGVSAAIATLARLPKECTGSCGTILSRRFTALTAITCLGFVALVRAITMKRIHMTAETTSTRDATLSSGPNAAEASLLSAAMLDLLNTNLLVTIFSFEI